MPSHVQLHTAVWSPADETPPIATGHRRTGPRTLLLHGVQSSGATWWRIADGLAAAGQTVVAPDLRGHGRSPGAVRYRLSDLGADVRALGDGWELVVGHSLGATLAAAILRDEPHFARRAVLLDPVLHLPEDDFEAIVRAQLDELANPPLADPGWHPEDVRLKALAARACSPYVNEAVLRDNRPWAYEHLLDGTDVPVLILGSDPAVGGMLEPVIGEAIADRTAAVTYRALPGLGHSPHRDDPALVLAALLERPH